MHPALKQALQEWRTQSHRTLAPDFVLPSRLYGGRKDLDLAAVLKRKIRPTFDKLGITGVGWHIFQHTVGTVLAELGEHQLTIRDYLRYSNLSVTNKYLQAASNTKRNARGETGCSHSSGAFTARTPTSALETSALDQTADHVEMMNALGEITEDHESAARPEDQVCCYLDSDAVAGFSVLSEGPIPSINFEFRDNVQGFLKRRSGSHFVEFQV
jgi:hypothetical protein